MKVVFLEDVIGTASAGDVKEVKPGFARNYLFLRGLAAPATAEQLNRVEALKKTAALRRAKTEGEMKALAEMLEGLTITMKAKAGANERLYGSITNMHIAEEMSKAVGFEIDRRKLALGGPIRQLGSYTVGVKLFQGVEPKVTVVVEAEGREKVAVAPVETAAAEGAPALSAPEGPAQEAPQGAATVEEPVEKVAEGEADK